MCNRQYITGQKERRRSWNVQVIVLAKQEKHVNHVRLVQKNAVIVNVGAKAHILAKNAKQISTLLQNNVLQSFILSEFHWG